MEQFPDLAWGDEEFSGHLFGRELALSDLAAEERHAHGQFDAEHGDELVQMHRRVIWPVSGERSRSNAGGGVGRGAQLFTLPLERCGAYAEPRSAFAMCMKNLVNSHGRTERGQRKF
ncbi:MAG: hypothetical protein CMJ17_00780 [Phenylobacterium sp.]|nr:hypothetical protein [Phenylobacterium sp.]